MNLHRALYGGDHGWLMVWGKSSVQALSIMHGHAQGWWMVWCVRECLRVQAALLVQE